MTADLRPLSSVLRSLFLASAFSFQLFTPAWAQDALRLSLSGQDATAQRKQELENIPYTVRWKDLRVLTSATLDAAWNDNVNLSESQPEQDFIIQPGLTLDATWPVTDLNLVNLSFGLSYQKYITYDQYSRMVITPGSELSWSIFAKDVVINLHDRFSYENDPIAYGNISGIGSIGGLHNTAGLSATWDLNDVVLTAGYDHANFIASAAVNDYMNSASDFGLVRSSFRVHPSAQLGVEGTGGPTAYEQDILSGFLNYSVGAFAVWKVGSRLDLDLRGGYTAYQYDRQTVSNAVKDVSGYYLGLKAAHQLKENLSYSLNAGRELTTSINGSLIEQWYAGVDGSWWLNRHLSLHAGFRYENATPSAGPFSPPYQRVSANLGFTSPLRANLNATLSYNVTLKDAEIQSYNYVQNRVDLLLTYRF